jgi:hypothetical protein
MRRLLLVTTLAALAIAGSALAGPVPSGPLAAIRKAAGPRAYLPASLPSGYRYTGWKNENPNSTASAPGAPLFVVRFANGRTRLLWTASLAQNAPENPCGALSVGHATIGGEQIYWSGLTTYAPLENGPKGRHVWRCLNPPNSGTMIEVDAFDQGGTLPIPLLSRIVARANIT